MTRVESPGKQPEPEGFHIKPCGHPPYHLISKRRGCRFMCQRILRGSLEKIVKVESVQDSPNDVSERPVVRLITSKYRSQLELVTSQPQRDHCSVLRGSTNFLLNNPPCFLRFRCQYAPMNEQAPWLISMLLRRLSPDKYQWGQILNLRFGASHSFQTFPSNSGLKYGHM
jgi:hypothetical protein